MSTPQFLARLARRAAAADAATPAARVAALADEIRRVDAERMRYVDAATGRVWEPAMATHVDDLVGDLVDLQGEFEAATEAARLAERPYLETVTRAYRAPRDPDMSLGSPLFNRMYAADRAYEQVARGRTANLRNAGGDLARIAGQAIRDRNAVAAASRSGGDGLLAGGLAAGGLTAAVGTSVVANAIEDRRLRQAQDDAANAAAVAAVMRRRAEGARTASEQMDALDSLGPVSVPAYVDEDQQRGMEDWLAESSTPRPFEPRSVNHLLREKRRDILLPDEDPVPLDLRYDIAQLYDGFDPVAGQVVSSPEPTITFTEDAADDDRAVQAIGAGELEAMLAADEQSRQRYADVEARMRESGAFPLSDPSASLGDPEFTYDLHTGQPRRRTGAMQGAPPPTRPTTPRPSSRGVRPLPSRSSGAWQ